MRIATRIGTGYAILIALILAVLTYQVSRLHQMESINRNLSGINFRAAEVSLRIWRDLDQAEEFTKKFYATEADPGYASSVAEMRDAVSQELQELESLRLSGQEQEDARRLQRLWSELLEASRQQDRPFRLQSRQQLDAALDAQLALFEQLRNQTQRLIRTTRQSIEAQVAESAKTGEYAERVSVIAAIVAFGVSLMVSWWIVRTISNPLRRLTEGTRAVAEGDFSYRLQPAGNDELAELAHDFNSMTRRLSELDEMKKDFVSHVSHELKSPLASVQETNRLLLEQIPGPLTGRQRQLLEVNLRSCQRLYSLIEKLLDLARIEAGVMEYQIKETDLVCLTKTALLELESRALEKKIRIDAELPGQPLLIECDGDRVVQVIVNLVDNALKFSPEGACVQVSLRAIEDIPSELPAAWRSKLLPARNCGFAMIRVADSGPGVAAGEKESIFEKFHRARQTKDKVIGTGLGLAIGRFIVEAHGGAIWVGDNLPNGSVFHVLLPAKAAPVQTGAWAPALPGQR